MPARLNARLTDVVGHGVSRSGGGEWEIGRLGEDSQSFTEAT